MQHDDLAGPPVEGCALEGIAQREHGQRYADDAGWHTFVPPPPELLASRMRGRRQSRAEQRYRDGMASGLSTYEAAGDAWGWKP